MEKITCQKKFIWRKTDNVVQVSIFNSTHMMASSSMTCGSYYEQIIGFGLLDLPPIPDYPPDKSAMLTKLCIYNLKITSKNTIAQHFTCNQIYHLWDHLPR